MRQINSHSAIVLRRLVQTRGLIICWLFAGGFGFTAAADDVSSQAEVEVSAESEIEAEVDALIDQAFVAREEVRTGRVTLTGHKHVEWLDSDYVFDGPVSGSYCFDRDANLFRYDGQVLCRIHIIDARELADVLTAPLPARSDTPLHQVAFGFCRAKDYFARWSVIGSNTSHGMVLLPLSREVECRKLECDQRPLDVMAFGMLSYFGLVDGLETVDAYGRALDMPAHSLEIDDQTVNIELRPNDYVWKIVFDRELMAPIQFDHGPLYDPTQFQSTTEWQVISDVAVPIKYSATFTSAEVAVETFDYELEWLSINEDIPDAEFEYTAFPGGPIGDYVTDMRTDPPTTLGIWVGDGEVERLRLPDDAN